MQNLLLGQSLLPPGQYQSAPPVVRQVIDIQVQRFVTEYRAEIRVFANWPTIMTLLSHKQFHARKLADAEACRTLTLAIPDERPLSRAAAAIRDLTIELVGELHAQGN